MPLSLLILPVQFGDEATAGYPEVIQRTGCLGLELGSNAMPAMMRAPWDVSEPATMLFCRTVVIVLLAPSVPSGLMT